MCAKVVTVLLLLLMSTTVLAELPPCTANDGVPDGYFIGPSGNRVDFHWHRHTHAKDKIKFDQAWDGAARLGVTSRNSARLKALNGLIAATDENNKDAAGDMRRFRRRLESENISWLGFEVMSGDPKTDTYDLEKKQFDSFRNELTALKAPSDKIDLALSLRDGALTTAAMTAKNGRSIKMTAIDLAGMKEGNKTLAILTAYENAKYFFRAKLSPSENKTLLHELNESVRGFPVKNNLQGFVSRMKQKYPNLTGRFDTLLAETKKMDAREGERNREMARNILAQKGNGIIEIGDGHRRGVIDELKKLCAAQEISASASSPRTERATAPASVN